MLVENLGLRGRGDEIQLRIGGFGLVCNFVGTRVWDLGSRNRWSFSSFVIQFVAFVPNENNGCFDFWSVGMSAILLPGEPPLCSVECKV